MKLYLEKRGCDFRADDAAETISDLGNYRLYLEFIDHDGKRVRGDVQRGCIRDGKRVISADGLYTHLCYERHSGCYGYRIPMQGSERLYYTKADALRLVNSASAVCFDGVEIVDELPAATAAVSEPRVVRIPAELRPYLTIAHDAAIVPAGDWAYLLSEILTGGADDTPAMAWYGKDGRDRRVKLADVGAE